MSKNANPSTQGSGMVSPVKRSGEMLGSGVILILLGTGAYQFGLQANADAYLRWLASGSSSLFGTARTPGDPWIVGGVIGALIGVILFVVGLNRLSRNVDRIAERVTTADLSTSSQFRSTEASRAWAVAEAIHRDPTLASGNDPETLARLATVIRGIEESETARRDRDAVLHAREPQRVQELLKRANERGY